MGVLKIIVVLIGLIFFVSFVEVVDKLKICFVYLGLKSDGGWFEV